MGQNCIGNVSRDYFEKKAEKLFGLLVVMANRIRAGHSDFFHMRISDSIHAPNVAYHRTNEN